jgi:hypothetical protein
MTAEQAQVALGIITIAMTIGLHFWPHRDLRRLIHLMEMLVTRLGRRPAHAASV